MTVVAPGQPSIPEPRGDDDEDVSWALSTAAAVFARGDPHEGLKWLRRAAETASDANRDARSLELFKAAADLSNHLKASGVLSSTPAPSRVTPAPPAVSSSAPPAANIAGRSSPPPPPRGRPTAGPHTAVMSQSAPTPRIDPMAALDAVAPTVPGPALPTRTTSHVTSGGTPFAPGPFQSNAPVSPQQLLLAQGVSRGTLVPGAKTLASNVTFDQLSSQRSGANGGDSVRIEISKAATITDAHARELANRAARQMHGTPGASSRATHPGVGPGSSDLATTAIQQPAQQQQLQRNELQRSEGAGVDARKITQKPLATSSPLPVGSVKPPPNQSAAQPQARLAASAGRDMARQSSVDATGDNAVTRVATTPPKNELRAMMPEAAPTVPGGLIDQRPASRGRRRSTMGGGRRASKPGADQRAAEESGGKGAAISEGRPPTARFEDEITIERDLSGVTTGLTSDLDENTNVLSGEELFVESDDRTPSSQATPVAPDKSPARTAQNGVAGRPRRSLSRMEQGRRPTTRVEGSQRASYPELTIPQEEPAAAKERRDEAKRENTEATTFAGLGDPRTTFESTTAENMSAVMAEPAVEVPPTEAFPMTGRSSPAPDLRRHAPSVNQDNLCLSAFRVAISLELVQGRLDVLPLAPGEPAPMGRFAAVIVAADVAASATLTEIVTRAMDSGDTVIHPLGGGDRRQRKS